MLRCVAVGVPTLFVGACGLAQTVTPMGGGHLGAVYHIDCAGNIIGEAPYGSRTVGRTFRNNIFDSGGYWSPLDIADHFPLKTRNSFVSGS
jgi:hypothetical protein